MTCSYMGTLTVAPDSDAPGARIQGMLMVYSNILELDS